MVRSGVRGQFSRGATQAATKNPPCEAGLAVSDKLSIAGDFFFKEENGFNQVLQEEEDDDGDGGGGEEAEGEEEGKVIN